MIDKSPHIQLRAVVAGTSGTSDALRAFTALTRLLTLLSQMEAGAIGTAGSTWGIEELRLGSVATVITPNRLADNADSELMANLLDWTISGFSQAEHEEVLPVHWPSSAIETGIELAKALGMIESDGMFLELIDDGRPLRSVTVTRRSADNLRSATRVKHTSIGSLIGRLDSVSIHSSPTAGLWTERGGRVEVKFAREHTDAVRAALGKRVEISGMLTRNLRDQPLSIRLKRIEELPEQDVHMDSIVGADPGLTEGLGPADHVRRMYDAS
ncbi:hypothetical protein Aph01nite_60810 [Acrocarpospora phusangensis]|uniref:Uncharacterized protein n=1 Tax=Acrocarpospora phusangensis TaxID=1070424 RepID=A0A919QH31_9ACTN|nr:hypothetical protein [Acrocarpospora phusangensis]GIH27771.1 hypothetical protein Aph01nite_60810 [Acrocarpospora phusangensis]